MAIYVCSVNSISRGQGRSAVAAAAYRSGEELYNEYTGMVSDYRKKGYVEKSKILLPSYTPKEQLNRAILQNAVEMAEKSKEGKLAIEIMVAIPVELTREQRELLIDEFAKSLVDQGMIIDYSIHNPPNRDDLGRPLDKDGIPTKDPEQMGYQLATIKAAQISERCHRRELKQIIERISKQQDLSGQVKNLSSINIIAHKRTTSRLGQIEEHLDNLKIKLRTLKEDYGYINPDKLRTGEQTLKQVNEHLKDAETQLSKSINREAELNKQYIHLRKSIPIKIKKTVLRVEINLRQTCGRWED